MRKLGFFPTAVRGLLGLRAPLILVAVFPCQRPMWFPPSRVVLVHPGGRDVLACMAPSLLMVSLVFAVFNH